MSQQLREALEKWAFNIIAALARQGYWSGTSEDHHDSERIVFQVLENMQAEALATPAPEPQGVRLTAASPIEIVKLGHTGEHEYHSSTGLAASWPNSGGREACGRGFESVCNRDKGHKGPCYWEAPIVDPVLADQAKMLLNYADEDMRKARPQMWHDLRIISEKLEQLSSSPAPATVAVAAPQEEIGWLIERRNPAPEYLSSLDVPATWTQDSLEAIRFARRKDAEKIAVILENEDISIEEHSWS